MPKDKLQKRDKSIIKKSYRANLLLYLSNPENPFPIRSKYGDILGKVRKVVYDHFSPDELLELENEAYENRKKACVKQRANVLKAMYESAIGYHHAENHISVYEGEVTITPMIKRYPPNKGAADTFLDRVEGKVKDVQEIILPNDRKFEFVERSQVDIRKKERLK